MVNSQAMPLSEKKRHWVQYKNRTFQKISSSSTQMFNYFVQQNDILNFISEDDFAKYMVGSMIISSAESSIFFTSMAGIFVSSKIIKHKYYPTYRPKFGIAIGLIKYIAVPFIITSLLEKKLVHERHAWRLIELQDKYRFGYEDYNKGNKIFERALAVNRLEELFEKRDKFDWRGIPELEQQN